jgi:hypothetical protein
LRDVHTGAEPVAAQYRLSCRGGGDYDVRLARRGLDRPGWPAGNAQVRQAVAECLCHGVIAGVERLECQQLDAGAPPVDRPRLSLGLHPRPDDQCRLRAGAGQVP